jgi:homoserine trans-succinylase
MNIYIVEPVGKFFHTEKELLKFLISEKSSKKLKVKVLNYTIEYDNDADVFLNSATEQIELDTKLNGVLGDEYSESVQKFIQMFKDLAPKSPWDSSKIRLSALKVLEQLQITPPTKEEFSKVVKRNSEYILYNVSDSVEWYKAVLSVYPFRKLTETCRTERIHAVTKGSTWDGHRTPTNMLKNFEKAKLSSK